MLSDITASVYIYIQNITKAIYLCCIHINLNRLFLASFNKPINILYSFNLERLRIM